MKGFGKFSFQTMLLVLGLLFVVYLIFHSMKYEGMKPGAGGNFQKIVKDDQCMKKVGGPGAMEYCSY